MRSEIGCRTPTLPWSPEPSAIRARYVTRRLLDQGVRVRTLTRSPDAEDPFGGRVEVAPLDFSDPDGLRRSMQGAGVFYNTYWIRYAHGRITFDLAVENTRTLFEAAKRAGVGRIVHFSVTNVSSGSGLPYFRGKAQVEDMLKGLGVPYAIIRPTLVFGVGDLLLNNMAWALRRFPVFPVSPGAVTIRSSLSTSKTLRPRRWRPALRARAPWPTLPGRTPSPSRPCFACLPPQWASEDGSSTRLRAWVSP